MHPDRHMCTDLGEGKRKQKLLSLTMFKKGLKQQRFFRAGVFDTDI